MITEPLSMEAVLAETGAEDVAETGAEDVAETGAEDVAETGAEHMAADRVGEILPPLDAAEVLERLRVMRGPDAETLYRAVALYGEIAGALRTAMDEILENPKLRGIYDEAVDGPVDGIDNLAFWGLHIAAAARDTSCFSFILRLLSLDDEGPAAFWGDADTENAASLIASTFDGDAGALLVFIGSAGDPLIGSRALLALAFLTWEKRIDRATAEAFLRGCFDERIFEAEDPRWYAWVVATGLLGMADFEPAVRTVFDEPLIDISTCGFEDWQSLIAEAAEGPDDIARFAAEDVGYLTDIYDALAWIADPEADVEDAIEDVEEDLSWLQAARNPAAGSDGPIHNPLRNVGRNDPCPCGSGKKYKKCCL